MECVGTNAKSGLVQVDYFDFSMRCTCVSLRLSYNALCAVVCMAGTKKWRVYEPLNGFQLPNQGSGDLPEEVSSTDFPSTG